MDLLEMIKKRVIYTIPGMEQSIVRPDILYKTVDGQDLCLDVYYPPKFSFSTELPAVVFIHGDVPAEMTEILRTAKNMGQYVSWGQLVAASGLIGVTFNHRSSEQKLSRMVSVSGDIRDLIDTIRSHAKELSIDRNSLCVWACSAGVPYLQAVMENPPEGLRCLVVYYGMMDFQQLAGSLPAEMDDKERESTQEVFRKFSLLAYLRDQPAALPPMFIAQAGLDDPSTNASINRFVTEAAFKDVKVDFVRHPAGRHAFDILNDDETTRTILQQTLRFMQDHLRSR
jgi:dipeptidyl aminopeptidase/acylaminoacyl peptidase